MPPIASNEDGKMPGYCKLQENKRLQYTWIEVKNPGSNIVIANETITPIIPRKVDILTTSRMFHSSEIWEYLTLSYAIAIIGASLKMASKTIIIAVMG